MTSTKLAKQVLRKEVKLKLANLSKTEKIRQSGVVMEMLFGSQQWQRSKRISLFLNMDDEVRTDEILRTALEQNKLCFIPRYVGSSMDMLRLYSWEDYQSLPVTSWNIKQPSDDDTSRENAIETGGLDLVLVPGLAFSSLGHRLGRGKGYYDSFLQRCKEKSGKNLTTIALAFNVQIYDNIPVSEHDISVDLVLYESTPLTNS